MVKGAECNTDHQLLCVRVSEGSETRLPPQASGQVEEV